MIFDTHAHYDDPRFDEDREDLLTNLTERRISHIINVGADLEGCRATVRLVESHPQLYGAVGIHPDYVETLTDRDLETIEQLCKQERIVAIGEFGLDYAEEIEDLQMRDKNHACQQAWMRRFLELARKRELPVIIHSRDAAADTLEIMKEHTEIAKAEGHFHGGVIHCFSYSPEMAAEYVKLGYYLGIGGVLTFKNAKRLPEVVQTIPSSSILLETDCPYLAPVPNRGKRNESSYIKYVVAKIAELRGCTEAEVEAFTEDNAGRFIHGIS